MGLVRKITCSRCSSILDIRIMFKQSYCLKCRNEYDRSRVKSKHPMDKKKRNCRAKAKYALKKGKLKRGPCVYCGNSKTEFHHDDYDKPLQVTNVCRLCHVEHHAKEKFDNFNWDTENGTLNV